MSLREQLESQLGKEFTLEREIFGGASARVFVALEHRLERRVVIKVLENARVSEGSAERFQREILIAAKLQQANIVPVLTVGEVDDLPYFTMPLIDGASLEERLREHERGLPYQEAITALRDLSRALEYAHKNGVVHRDIKPGNVLISGGSAMITDFGIATAITSAHDEDDESARGEDAEAVTASEQVAGLDQSAPEDDTEVDSRLTLRGSIVGSPAYMAPEQIFDEDVDHRADLFAFGCLAYEILTGEVPFKGRTFGAQVSARLTMQPTQIRVLRKEVPPHVGAVIMRCLEREPDDRPQTATEIGRELESRGPTSLWLRWAVAAAIVGMVGIVGYTAKVMAGASEVLPQRVLVLPFENQTRDEQFDDIGVWGSSAVTRATTAAGFVDVLRMSAALEEVLAESGSASPRFEKEVAEQGVTTLITGMYQRRGDTLFVQAQITDVDGITMMEEVGPFPVSASDPIPGLRALSERIAGTLAARLDPVMEGLASMTSQPPSFEAHREVSAAEVKATQYDFAGAIDGFARADSIGNDPDYLFPRVRTATMLYELRSCELAAPAAYAVISQRERLSTFEELTVEAVIAGCRGDRNQQYLAFKRRAELAPTSVSSQYDLAQAALAINRPAEAVRILEAMEPGGLLTSSSGYYQKLQWGLHALGDHDRELEVSEIGMAGAPPIGLVVLQQLPYAALGRIPELEAVVDHGVTMIDAGWDARMVLQIAALELRAHGDTANSRRMARRLVDWMNDRPPADRAGVNPFSGVSGEKEFDFVLSRAHYLAGDYAAADSVLEAGPWPESDRLQYLSSKGVVAAALGDQASALAASARLADLNLEYSLGEDFYARGRIAASLGDLEGAVRLLQDAVRAGVYFAFYSYHWHLDPALDSLKDHPGFQRLIGPKG